MASTTNLLPGPLRVSGVCVSAGGTRILNMVGLRDPGEDSVAMGSLPVAEVGPVGYLPQDDALHGALTVPRELASADLCSPQTDSLCVSSQGRRTPVSICMDGRAISRASPALEVLDPRGLCLVEAYSRVGRVAMYSRGYVARLIETGQQRPPFSFGCGGLDR